MAEHIERELTCEDCIHYDICIFHHYGDENKKCPHFKNKADVVSVVRCKECKDYSSVTFLGKPTHYGYCCNTHDSVLGNRHRFENDFCSYGAKMDGKGDGK